MNKKCGQPVRSTGTTASVEIRRISELQIDTRPEDSIAFVGKHALTVIFSPDEYVTVIVELMC